MKRSTSTIPKFSAHLDAFERAGAATLFIAARLLPAPPRARIPPTTRPAIFSQINFWREYESKENSNHTGSLSGRCGTLPRCRRFHRHLEIKRSQIQTRPGNREK